MLLHNLNYEALYFAKRRAVGLATGYGLDDEEVGVRVPVGARIFTLHVDQTDSGAHSAYYPMGTRGYFPGGKAAEA
jgi:hypothetical protein